MVVLPRTDTYSSKGQSFIEAAGAPDRVRPECAPYPVAGRVLGKKARSIVSNLPLSILLPLIRAEAEERAGTAFSPRADVDIRETWFDSSQPSSLTLAECTLSQENSNLKGMTDSSLFLTTERLHIALCSFIATWKALHRDLRH